jgi:hypothetical protein
MAEPAVSDDIRIKASALGLTLLTDAHLKQLAKAEQSADARRSLLQTGSLVPSDEPAHVYRLP